MKIAIVSGKGGTGKTFVTTNLAFVASLNESVTLFDLDVEEPNAGLFFDGQNEQQMPVERMIPIVDESQCDHCGVCSEVCEYHAIITLANQVLVFPELCHSCYGCLEMCPTGAISEGKKEIGTIVKAQARNVKILTGRLKIGESATTQLIRQTKRTKTKTANWYFFDAPPGTSCPVIEAVKDMDFVLLVAEPTPFGLHDMDLLVQVLRQLDKPFAVVINKSQSQENVITQYCQQNGIEILASLPLDEEIARANAQGKLVSQIQPDVQQRFADLLQALRQKVEEVVA